MNDFTESMIREVTTRYLQDIALDLRVDMSKLSASRRESFKRQAGRILKSELFMHILRDLADQAKNILLLKAVNNESVLVNRGFLLGLQAVEKNLRDWTAHGLIQTETEE